MIAYIPGKPHAEFEPLAQYLPPIPEGVISAWLSECAQPGSWILDPFGASPRLAVEAARAGYKVLVAANNPVARFLLEMASNPPKSDDLISALAELAASYKGDERIEPYIRSFYNTRCARCGQIVSADAFYWETGNPSPYMRVYTCPACGDSGEHPCTPFDAEQAAQFTVSGLHKARALERVVATTDQDRIHVEQALSVYIPRALQALLTLINKIEGLAIDSHSQALLSALLLYAFDQANSLWKVPNQRERRRQLAIPRHFRENNVWHALEQAIHIWSVESKQATPSSVPFTIWPELPASNGVCLYEGRLVSLANSLPSLDIKSICAAIPRPNQAFWTLSALWSGWLWGREAVTPFKSVLHRQRYDWGWHTTALVSVFKLLSNSFEQSVPFFGIIGEAEPGFIASALIAGGITGLELNNIALRPDTELAQIQWTCKKVLQPLNESDALLEPATQSARSYLESRAEPASYINTISAAFVGIDQFWVSETKGSPALKTTQDTSGVDTSEQKPLDEPVPSLIYSKAYNSAREALSFRSGFLRFRRQEPSSYESNEKDLNLQSALFTLELEQANAEETETPDIVSDEVPASAEKERPARSSDISESSLLWLRDTSDIHNLPITDRYESALVSYLINHPGASTGEVDTAMCQAFPGLFTPDLEFIQVCLESYADYDTQDRSGWYIRPTESLLARQTDLADATQHLLKIGERLGFICEQREIGLSNSSITWVDKIAGADYLFVPVISASIAGIILTSPQPTREFIVTPGSRANLLIYKLRQDSRLSRAFHPSQGNWKFLKFRHIRSLLENPALSRDTLDQLLELDPLTYSTPQLRMI